MSCCSFVVLLNERFRVPQKSCDNSNTVTFSRDQGHPALICTAHHRIPPIVTSYTWAREQGGQEALYEMTCSKPCAIIMMFLLA